MTPEKLIETLRKAVKGDRVAEKKLEVFKNELKTWKSAQNLK